MGVWRTVADFVREVVQRWQRDNATTQGAALAYYTLFSVAPLLVLVIILAGLVLGRAAAQGQVFTHIQDLVGPDTARTVEEMVRRASTPRAGIVPTVVSLAAVLFGASSLIGQLRGSLNHIWGVSARGGGVRGMIRQRAIALGVIGGIGLLLLASMALSAVLAAVQQIVTQHLPLLGPLLVWADAGLSLLVAIAFFALVFRFVPDTPLGWRELWPGAAMTALLFTVGKSLIGLYLGRAATTSIYGAAGSLVLLLLWVYYSAQILLLGAVFTGVYARRSASTGPGA
ncbi:MAG TPA: YihY/virulence factor BrkB family protein [Candidatus Binatus sp.]|nr:YihY/virulence factor BrkB family protein [Candidatus Binatus sp.]